MATIEERSGGKYRIKVFMGEDCNGKALFKSKTVTPKETAPSKRKRELDAIAHEFEKECKEGRIFDGEKLTFSAFYEKWYEECSGQLTPAERESSKANVTRIFFPEIGTLPMSSITPLHIQRILNRLTKEGKSAKTVRKYYSQISPVFKKAYQWRIIENNPTATGLIDLPSMTKNSGFETFTEDQARRFLSFCSNGTIDILIDEKIRKNGRIIPAHYETYQIPFQIYILFMLACFTGMRRGELLALTWEDVDLMGCMAHVKHSVSHAKEEGGRFVKDPKTASGNRIVPLPSFLVPLLTEWKQRQEEMKRNLGSAWQGATSIEKQFLFIQDNGKGMDIYTPTKWFGKAIRLYNLTAKDNERIPETLTLHDCRHFYASTLIANNIPIATVSRLCGHADVAITMKIYCHDVKDTDETRSQIETIFQVTGQDKNGNQLFLG